GRIAMRSAGAHGKCRSRTRPEWPSSPSLRCCRIREASSRWAAIGRCLGSARLRRSVSAMCPSAPPPTDQAAARASARPRGNGALSHPLPAGMRDLLPIEAERQLNLSRATLESFERFGYEPVSVPPFEYAEVLE